MVPKLPVRGVGSARGAAPERAFGAGPPLAFVDRMSLRPVPRPAHSIAPKRLGPYVLIDCIARGGTAAVYRAKRRGAAGFEKPVVVKMILPELAQDPRFVRFFAEEARLVARLCHANIAQVQDLGVIGGTAYLELEYLAGMNLKQLWELALSRRELIPLGVTLAIVTEACRGLAFAHAFVDENGRHRPIIHRDVSPANVMVCFDGAVKILDFGMASMTRGETLSIDTLKGKPAYASPEQLERRQVDRRADVFALGTLLHELLTGRRLFAAENDIETLRRIATLPIEPPSKRNPQVPSFLDKMVLKALARDPDARYQSAGELLAELEGLSALTASRARLVGYLAQVAPEIYGTPCDACGRRLAPGAECTSCKTDVGEELPPEQPVALSLVQTPPSGSPIYSLEGPLPTELRVLTSWLGALAEGGRWLGRAALSVARWLKKPRLRAERAPLG